MADGQDTNSKANSESPEKLKDGAPNKTSQISTASNALGDNSLDEVSGGAYPSPT